MKKLIKQFRLGTPSISTFCGGESYSMLIILKRERTQKARREEILVHI